MLVTAVLLLALHYFLQMRFSIRATTDAGATVVNSSSILPLPFSSPAQYSDLKATVGDSVAMCCSEPCVPFSYYCCFL